MAKREDFKLTTAEKMRRHFSDGFKKQKVREIEMGKTKVSEIQKQYQVSSTSIYRWMSKFGSMKKPERLIVETKSDTSELLLLKKKLAELEQIIGQKQIKIDFQSKMIELAEEQYGVDIKKKFSTKPSTIIGKTEKS